jgi:hypothetical protein
VLTFAQVGGNVLATGNGTLNPMSLTFEGTVKAPAGVNPTGGLRLGNPNPTGDMYGNLPYITYGTAGLTNASSATGDYFGLFGESVTTDYLIVPTGYASGSSLSGTATCDNTTISALGMTPGTYTWTWGSGATADSLKVIIPSTSAVPEPASYVVRRCCRRLTLASTPSAQGERGGVITAI